MNESEIEIFKSLKQSNNCLYRNLLMLVRIFNGEDFSEEVALDILDDICSTVDEIYNIGGYEHGIN